MNSELERALAKVGAQHRLNQITQERQEICRAFPGIEDEMRKAQQRENMAKARSARAEKIAGRHGDNGESTE